MKEIVLNGKKNGMAVLLLTILLQIASIVAIINGIMTGPLLVIVGLLVFFGGFFIYPGLKVLKPQEALVLTLFGKYIGTIKGEGFYFVNPFCSAVNPAAKTRLNQSGDVDNGKSSIVLPPRARRFRPRRARGRRSP